MENKVNRKFIILQVFIILLSISLILIGIYRNEVQIILQKAIYICLECIGIG